MHSLHRTRSMARAWRRHFQIGPELARQLTAASFKALNLLSWLEACSRRDRPNMAPLVQCGQGYIAGACGVDRSTINRCLNGELVPLGLVEMEHRDPHHATGLFRTCLYRVTARARQLLGLHHTPGARDANPPAAVHHLNRVMYTAHPTVVGTLSSTGFADFLRMVRARRQE